MIRNEKSWHYLRVTKLSVLLRRITSKNNDDFCYLNCLHFFRTENKLKSYENVCKNISGELFSHPPKITY